MGSFNNLRKLKKTHKRMIFFFFMMTWSVCEAGEIERYRCELQTKTEATKNAEKKQPMIRNPHLLHFYWILVPFKANS